MKTILIAISLHLLALLSSAQITFQKTFGGTNDDQGQSVLQTANGGYIITGNTKSFGNGLQDVYLIRTDAYGDTLWTRSFGGSSNDNGYSAIQTSDSGYIIIGSTSSSGAGLNDVYLIRTDANGDSLWTKTIGGINDDCGYAVKQTSDGGYIIAGSYFGSNSDVYLIKTDANGDSLWTKTFGGAIGEEAYSVQQTTDGGFIISGWTISFGAGNRDVYLIKTDSIGDSLWTKTFGGTDYDIGRSVQQTVDGGYIIVGVTRSFGVGNMDFYLIKTDSNGDTLWTKAFGGTIDDYGYSVDQSTDGGYIINGYTNSFSASIFDYDVYLIKTDSIGNSGCNQGNTATIVTTPATLVSSPATIITSPPTIVTTPATIIGSGGIINTLCTTVGINEIKTVNPFFISPNPSVGNFIISFEGMIMKGNIEILNILGETVFAENILNETKREVNLKNISQGIYFVKVFNGEKYYCKKIIVEHD